MNIQVFGKVIGGLLGWFSGGPAGLVIGLLIGHAFDRGLGRALSFGSPENIERIKGCFFETTFLLSGYLAKVDGQISPSEIDHTEQIFQQMGLDAEQRKRGIDLFHQGAASDFQCEPVIERFVETCGPQIQVRQTLLFFLVSLALADRTVEPAEHAALVRIGGLIGVGPAQLEQMLRMAQAQEQFHHEGSGPGAQATASPEDAYTALGVDPSISDKDLKRAYRKLMSENHPDKLMAKGVPEDMIKVATTRSQEIQAAYEAVKKTRPGMR